MPFLTPSKANIRFVEKEPVSRTYIAAEALPMTRKVEIIDKKEFAAAALNVHEETFVVYLAALAKPKTMPIHLFCHAQVTTLTSNETGIPAKYSDFFNVFSSDFVAELPEYTGINDHFINLLDNKQPPYRPIYSLGLVELEILKTYIEANLASGFIRPSKFPASTLILFVQKKNGSFCLCRNYQGLNNLTIKNRYLLPLISKLLNCLGRTKRFTQLDVTNAYHQMRIWKGDEWKTAFQMRYGYFKYQIIPFGLFNTPASF